MKAPRSRPEAARRYPRATYLIKHLERAVRQSIDEVVEPYGLTALQYTALSVLARNPGTSASQLARRSFVSPQAAHEMVAALERGGLIRRKPGPRGGRALWIQLTPAGERTLTRCEAQVDALEARLFRGMTHRDQTRFRAMLRACSDALREPDSADPRAARDAASGE